MKLPSVTVKQLLEAGVHLGHKTFRWNPKMSSYIFELKDKRKFDFETLKYLNREPYIKKINI